MPSKVVPSAQGADESDSLVATPPLEQDTTTLVPPPFSLAGWLRDHAAELDAGATLPLFSTHPDGEFGIHVGGAGEARAHWRHETFLHQLAGSATVSAAGMPPVQIDEGSCMLVPAETEYVVSRPPGGRTLAVTNDPLGNAPS